NWARVDDRGSKTVRRVVQDEQPTVGERHGTEEANFRIGDRLDRARSDFVSKDIGYASVIAAAIQVASVLGEGKAFRHRLSESELGKRLQVAVQELLQLPHAQELVAVGLCH